MIKEQLKDFKLAHFKISEKRSRGKALGILIKFGKNIFKSLKKLFTKAKPIKGGPKAAKGGVIGDSTTVSQKSLGTGGKIMSNFWS